MSGDFSFLRDNWRTQLALARSIIDQAEKLAGIAKALPDGEAKNVISKSSSDLLRVAHDIGINVIVSSAEARATFAEIRCLQIEGAVRFWI